MYNPTVKLIFVLWLLLMVLQLTVSNAAKPNETENCPDVSPDSIGIKTYNMSNGEPMDFQDTALQSTWITHGYGVTSTEPWIKTMMHALTSKKQEGVLVVVDWSAIAGQTYQCAASLISPVAKEIVKYVGRVNPELAHFIGHSMGAHVFGVVGNLLFAEMRKHVGRITGLDAARATKLIGNPRSGTPATCVHGDNTSCFELMDATMRLTKASAKFVDAYHTSAGYLGLARAYGHVDVYFGACGLFQCECPESNNMNEQQQLILNKYTCSHAMAQEYYIRTIEDEDAYKAKSSETCGEYLALPVGDRVGNTTVGYDIRHVTGIFYVGGTNEKCMQEVTIMELNLKDFVTESPSSDKTDKLRHMRAKL